MGPAGRRGTSTHKAKAVSKPKKAKLQPGRKQDAIRDETKTRVLESKSLPVSLQQLLLNIFRCGLILPDKKGENAAPGSEQDGALTEPLLLSQLVQNLKARLYHRDFASAFASATEEELMAYALRWSAGRALGYAGIFTALWEMLLKQQDGCTKSRRKYVICVGGGAGAEIVALAAAWRYLRGNIAGNGRLGDPNVESDEEQSLDKGLNDLSLREAGSGDTRGRARDQYSLPQLNITAVDIANWSSLITKLRGAITSDAILSSNACPAPLLSQQENDGFSVAFEQADVLHLTKEELKSTLFTTDTQVSEGDASRNRPAMVTLMFTLNELFSTSMPKTTAFLLHLTGLLEPGTILLVVDSPGSYSTVTLGGNKENSASADDDGSEKSKPQRKYPMRFLLEHTLLTTAAGEWECVVSDESRWFRRDASKLRYEVGDGIGLEDMRYQIHVYRKIES